jgi:hypothetical protein
MALNLCQNNRDPDPRIHNSEFQIRIQNTGAVGQWKFPAQNVFYTAQSVPPCTDSELLQTAIFSESQMKNINHIGLPIS